MNSDLKTKLFANVLLNANEQPAVFKLPGRRAVSLGGAFTAAFAILSAAGLVFFAWSKIKPLF
ncbi:MAG TPA: hypothetical protein VE954_22110 [Oligoflexus sp.]|uniref:hypothetical protein n=1 Tax=Oligoflexus sp. TaxID=1971216 RepID=UPI002D352B61|nr:hypothetical protein [Oligoflexus sp.]HYX35802.1 hypothetical protein [Oligoflexus sp.]